MQPAFSNLGPPWRLRFQKLARGGFENGPPPAGHARKVQTGQRTDPEANTYASPGRNLGVIIPKPASRTVDQRQASTG